MADIKPPKLPDSINTQKPKEVKKPNLNLAPMSTELGSRESKSVVKNEKITQQAPELVLSSKTKKIVISVVAVVLALVLALGVAFAVWPKPARPAEIFINFNVTGEFDFDDVELDHTMMAGQSNKVMPGDSFNARFDISSTDDEGSTEEVYVRIKLYAIAEDNLYSDMFSYNFTNDNWYVGYDGYIYLKQTLKANTSIELCNKLNFDKEIGNYFQGKTVQVFFEAECLQAGSYSYQAITEEWPTAPYQWKALFYENRG